MPINSLTELKAAISAKKLFRVLDVNYVERIGSIRQPNIIEPDGFFAVNYQHPDAPESNGNNGKGIRLDYLDEECWEFKDGVCTQYTTPHKWQSQKIISFVFLEDKNICCKTCQHIVHAENITCDKLKKIVADTDVCEKYRSPDDPTKFTMVIGLPYSGKNTWAKTQDANIYGLTDKLATQIEQPEQFENLYQEMLTDLNAKKDVVFVANNLTKVERDVFMQQLDGLNLQKIAVVIASDLSETVSRNNQTKTPIDKTLLHTMYDTFEHPKLDDNFDKIYYFHDKRLRR